MGTVKPELQKSGHKPKLMYSAAAKEGRSEYGCCFIVDGMENTMEVVQGPCDTFGIPNMIEGVQDHSAIVAEKYF